MSGFNEMVIDEFRANGGVVTEAAPFGSSLVLLHTVGAKSGEPRISPVFSLADGDSWLVAASMAGAPSNPAWYHNLIAHPDASIEVGHDGEVRTVDVVATELQGADRDAAWERFKEASDGFGAYEQRTSRTIPVLRLSVTGSH